MKTWIKFLKDYESHKAGEIVQVDEAEAKTLIKTLFAEATKEPEEVDAKVKELTASITTIAKAEAKAAFDGLVKDLKAQAERSRRPGAVAVGKDNEDDDPNFGFKNIGEQIRTVKDWYGGSGNAKNDERMKRVLAKANAPSTYANEGTGADGGFLIAPTFANTILAHTFTDESLYARTDTYTTGGNSLTIPKDETTPWGTSGVQVYWTAEAAQLTQSKPKLGQDNLVLHKITAIVPVTDEQLQDSFTGLGNYVTKQATERIRWAVDDAIVNGTGAGKPIGFFNSPALVSQAKVTSQTAATINITNIASMLSRIPNLDPSKCVWLVHPAAYPQLVILTNGNQSMYIAAGGIGNANPRLGTLFGIPVMISQHCPATVGTQGDIFLVDLSKYITLSKGDGIQTAMSMHLFFDYNVSAFRFNFRVAGQPWLQSSITSAYGSYTMSPFITLDTRS